MQLMSHPFIKKYEGQQVDLAGFVQSVFDPTERLKDLSDVSSYSFSWFENFEECVFSLEFFFVLPTPYVFCYDFMEFALFCILYCNR